VSLQKKKKQANSMHRVEAERVEGVHISPIPVKKYPTTVAYEKVAGATPSHANFVPGSPFSPRRMIVANILPSNANTEDTTRLPPKSGGRRPPSEEVVPQSADVAESAKVEATTTTTPATTTKVEEGSEFSEGDEKEENETDGVDTLTLEVLFEEICNSVREERTERVLRILGGEYRGWKGHPRFKEWVSCVMKMEDEWFGESLLHLATCNGGDGRVLVMLIKNGADVLARDKHGNR